MTTIQIKKAGQDPQIINVPEGAKIVIEDGITIVEPKFKNGDIVFGSYNGNSWIGIFNKYINNNAFEYHARICNYSLEYSDYVSIGLAQRHATESEKQLLFDAIAKDGMQWNPDTKQIEDLIWKPKRNELYYVPDVCDGELYSEIFNEGHCFDEICIERNIAFKTPEEAIEIAKKWLQQL
jgi:hypothetical protein